ncbi:MAG: hypothetical protein ACPGLY_26420, partial [Rubripirellula sp.]
MTGRFEAVEKWLESQKYSISNHNPGNWGAIASFLVASKPRFLASRRGSGAIGRLGHHASL